MAQRFWMRARAREDARAPEKDAKVLVELSVDGRVHAVSAAADLVESTVRLDVPSEGEGLMLYAQQTADIHLGTADGPVIGRIHRGALVSVVPADEQFAMAVPGFRNSGAMGADVPLVALVRADALGPAKQTLTPPTLEGRLVEDFPPNAPLWAVQGEPAPFAKTLCGDIRVMSDGPAWSRVSQYHAGVELVGWYDHPIEVERGPMRCTRRLVIQEEGGLVLTGGETSADRTAIDAVPAGFVRDDHGGDDRLAEHMTKGRSVYWLTRAGTNAICSEWTFERARKPRTATIEASFKNKPTKDARGVRILASFEARYAVATADLPGKLTLFGPDLRTVGGAETVPKGEGTTVRCAESFSFVGRTADALRFLAGAWPSGVVAGTLTTRSIGFSTRLVRSGGASSSGGR